jgi:plastocyanin
MRRSKLGSRVVLGACAVAVAMSVSAVPSLAAGKTIRATEDRTFSPAATTVAKGTKVTWRNASDDDHNVTGYGKWTSSLVLAEGGSAAKTFTKAGTYKYRCTLHSTLSDGKCNGMCGKVVVR